jgi:hypothetical protein
VLGGHTGAGADEGADQPPGRGWRQEGRAALRGGLGERRLLPVAIAGWGSGYGDSDGKEQGLDRGGAHSYGGRYRRASGCMNAALVHVQNATIFLWAIAIIY